MEEKKKRDTEDFDPMVLGNQETLEDDVQEIEIIDNFAHVNFPLDDVLSGRLDLSKIKPVANGSDSTVNEYLRANDEIAKRVLHIEEKTQKPSLPKIFQPIVPPKRLGDYQDNEEFCIVKYADDVAENEQVIGLCSFLEKQLISIRHFFREHFEGYDSKEPIRVFLKRDCPIQLFKNNEAYIAKKINELVDKNQKVTVAETKSILCKKERVLGRFILPNREEKDLIDSDPRIEIYFRQFDWTCWEEYAARITKTLAHEYAHYCEYLFCNREGATPFQKKCVSEAIADFFGVFYSVQQGGQYGFQVAEERYQEWKEFFESNWPYAYALYFLKDVPDGIEALKNNPYEQPYLEKFIRVLDATPRANIALRILKA